MEKQANANAGVLGSPPAGREPAQPARRANKAAERRPEASPSEEGCEPLRQNAGTHKARGSTAAPQPGGPPHQAPPKEAGRRGAPPGQGSGGATAGRGAPRAKTHTQPKAQKQPKLNAKTCCLQGSPLQPPERSGDPGTLWVAKRREQRGATRPGSAQQPQRYREKTPAPLLAQASNGATRTSDGVIRISFGVTRKEAEAA